MLNFIVLGIIPGTSITLTFSWVLTIGLVVSLITLWQVKRFTKATTGAVKALKQVSA